MEINRLSGYSDFLGIVEYPAVVFCEDGEVISINNAALQKVDSDRHLTTRRLSYGTDLDL